MDNKFGLQLPQYDNHLGCFGNFNLTDQMCRRHCALRLRCAIERNQNDRLEILEDLVSMEEINISRRICTPDNTAININIESETPDAIFNFLVFEPKAP